MGPAWRACEKYPRGARDDDESSGVYAGYVCEEVVASVGPHHFTDEDERHGECRHVGEVLGVGKSCDAAGCEGDQGEDGAWDGGLGQQREFGPAPGECRQNRVHHDGEDDGVAFQRGDVCSGDLVRA